MHAPRCTLIAVLLLTAASAQADLTIPGADGSDGSLHVTEDMVIDLGLATEGAPGNDAWQQDNTANAGNGVYDPDKWAVVFKYASVTVDAGATLSFINHPSGAPVVWLVSGNVTIDGTVSVNGANGAAPPALAAPGPGGFRGGMGYFSPGVDAAPGFGPGGGNFDSNSGFGASYGSQGGSAPPTYGNPSLLPLIGGSGGGGDGNHAYGGGAGGGALLIAAAGMVAVDGVVRANGGNGPTACCAEGGGGGSGGGVRIVAGTLEGIGVLQALGGGGDQNGGLGRIRVEYVDDFSNLAVTPSPSVVPLVDGSNALIWPPSEAPSARILSIGGEPIDADPRASFGTYGADAVLPETATTEVVVETVNVEQASQVQVRVTPRTNTGYTYVDAVVLEVDAVDPSIVRWVAQVPVTVGYSALQAKVIRP